jgi:phosphatidate cytidylyltransferase
MNNFWARTITGLSMVFILLLSLCFSRVLFSAFFFTLTVLGLWEFFTITTTDYCKPQRMYGTIAGALLYIGIVGPTFIPIEGMAGLEWIYIIFLVPIPVFIFSFIFEIYRKQDQPLLNVAVTTFGIIYVTFPLSLLSLMNGSYVLRSFHLPAFLTGYLLLTWIYDTGAYLYGKQFGKHKFFERISPKKTWEGTIAGSAISMLAAIGLFYLVKEVQLTDWLMLTVIVLIFGTFGDLFESLIKRSLNLKDSGSMLPGHGGILDRFDTIFLSAPFVFLYLVFRNLLFH